MTDRPPAEILAEWRAAERELDEVHDERALEALQARIALLRDEHRAACDARAAEARDLGSVPRYLNGDAGSGKSGRLRARP